MNIVSLITSLAFTSYLYIGIFVFFINPKSSINRSFLWVCLVFALWSFGYIFIHNSMDYEKSIFWYKVAFTGASLHSLFGLNFSLAISGIINRIKRKELFYILISILPCIILYKNITECAIIRDFPYGLWFLLWMANGYLYNFTFCFIIFQWRKKSKMIREKKQAALILISSIIAIILSSLSDTVLVSLNIPSLSPVIVLIWLFSIGYAVVKYRFMSITPEFVSKDIIESINDSIILLDEDLKIITINKKTAELLNTTRERMSNQSISDFIQRRGSLEKEMENLFQGKYSDFSCRINYQLENGQRLLMDTKFSVVKDKFNDIIGILIIGHEVKELKQLKLLYKMTEREADVIQHIISGSTNKEAADQLGVTERTVKAHITNIYNKFGANNKMQLLNLLKEFDLIPEQSSERILFLNK